MPDKRLVHDILSEGEGDKQRRPVAFVQHGNREDGNTYEGICPWCGETTCYVPAKQTNVIGGLYRVLLHQQKLHWQNCSARPSVFANGGRQDFAVEITTTPLNVEKPITFN